ncbi:hypothetical protein LUZ60_001648 [Juncus effusus]|nr:hypothetical protein LUZ60_001648 [Juncus effusus]
MAFSLNQLKGWYYSFILIRMQSFARAFRYVAGLLMLTYRFVANHVHPFWIQFSYFIFIDLLGTLLLMELKPTDPTFEPRLVDMFFMSTSALTVSGLATVQMERLSSSQIVVLSLLMLLGGEVFVSVLNVFFRAGKQNVQEVTVSRVNSVQIELESIESISTIARIESGMDIGFKDLSQSSLKYLGYVLLGYWVFFHLMGFIACFIYVSIISSAKGVLNGKGINLGLFSFSTTISSFANGGLIATNENMGIFAPNSGLLLFQIVLILVGNTLLPLVLRFSIWILKVLTKNEEFDYMINNPREIKFDHLLPNLRTFFRSATVIGMITVMVTMFCSINWRSPVFDGLNSYQKIVAALFMGVNARHSGENSIDPSLMSPGVLIFMIFMMYLPSSTTFMPIEELEEKKYEGELRKTKGKGSFITRIILMPQIACLVIFIIVACIIERQKMLNDPLNFSVLNMIFETTSAYGNVGISLNYSCARLQRLHPEMKCVDEPYSFVGFWSDEGKLLIAFVMIYGWHKKYSERNGKAWKLLA